MILYDIKIYILFYRIVYPVVLYIFIYNWPQTMFCIHILIQFTVGCRPYYPLKQYMMKFQDILFDFYVLFM